MRSACGSVERLVHKPAELLINLCKPLELSEHRILPIDKQEMVFDFGKPQGIALS